MKSFGLLRTNVGLTTNVRVVVDSKYNLSLDSIESHPDLSLDKFKKVKFSKKNYYDELIPYFYKKLPSDTAYHIKYEDDAQLMSSDFSKQYDEMYQYGARNILNNKNYSEEFEYFAPLYINKNNLPSNFIVFRLDGPGIELMNKENFIEDIVNNLKAVKIFDFSLETSLGEWLNNNFKSNKYFPLSPLEVDFRELEFCKWNGIDYESGGYTSKSLFIDDYFEEERELFEFEKYIFDTYRINKVVYPNIINFSFLFDDEPSTPDFKRKWSINRYYGFYIDKMEKVTSISPYITPFLRDDVKISDGNMLYSPSNEDPFLLGFDDKKPYYIEYKGEYYRVEKVKTVEKNRLITVPEVTKSTMMTEDENSDTRPNLKKKPSNITNIDQPKQLASFYVNIEKTQYKIISNLDLKGKEDEINKNFGRIDSSNNLINYENTYLEPFEDFDQYSVWLININGVYHNIVKEEGILKLSTDYSFIFNENNYSYKVAGVETIIDFRVDFNNPPKKFDVYRLSFSDIKDFDTRIVDTESSKFEYIKKDELTETDETKMYVENLLTTTTPKDYDDYIYKGDVVNIPVSSEYTANYETFKVTGGELSEIWRKNSVYCRWGYLGSISANDYPYLLNNSSLFEDYNRTANPFDPDPKRMERNLDYFYSINSSTNSYVHHSLHIEGYDSNGDLDPNFFFDLNKYLNTSTYSSDYFSDFFYQKQYFDNGEIVKNVKKYSEFTSGDNSISNTTLFRGLKFSIYNVDGVDVTKDNEIGNINLSTSNKYDGYKFSILLSDNDQSVDNSGKLVNSYNKMKWDIITRWTMDKIYASGSIVIFDDILYRNNSYSNTKVPVKQLAYRTVKSAPYNIDEWDYFSPGGSIFWQPNTQYNIGDFVFNNNEFYECVSIQSTSNDFWNPSIASIGGYDTGSIAFFKDKYYVSNIENNQYQPDSATAMINPSTSKFKKPWSEVSSSEPKWYPIELWNPIAKYNNNKLIAHNNTVYKSNSNVDAGNEPGTTTRWVRLYSLVPDTDFIYSPASNSVIEMNDNYYVCLSNENKSTLDNGIIIYVNKKWKNILININVSDNTIPNVKNIDRDELYSELYRKFTALNFTRSINDIDTKYEFTDYVTYVIINEDGSVTKHNFSNNIKNLPCLIRVEEPDDFTIKSNSIKFNVIENPKQLKPLRKLSDGNIRSLSQINWYNDLPYAVDIVQNRKKQNNKVFGNRIFTGNQIFRHSGFYMPIFYDIQLFDKKIDGITDNTRFDIELTDFALMKERKIQKVNRNGSLLKLRKEQDVKSVYPMLDEFGYTIRDFFIFASTWDLRYHYESYILTFNPRFEIEIPSIKTETIKEFGQPKDVKKENQKNIKL
jgi:hypothetical protein